jgi:Protein of unknown function (DUF1574)
MVWNRAVRRLRRGPWGAIGAVVLAIACETYVQRQDIAFGSSSRLCYREVCRTVARVESESIVCMGDSLVKMGLSPQVLEARLGRPTLNAAAVGGQSPLSYFLLKRIVDRGVRPALVIVDFKSTQLQADPRIVSEFLAEALSPWECLQLAVTFRDRGFFGRLITQNTLPSARARNDIRKALVAALAGQKNPAPALLLPALRNWAVNQGAWMMDKNENVETTSEYWDEKVVRYLGRFATNYVTAEYLRKFLKLAAAHDIPVYWVLPPINPRVRASRDKLGWDDEYVAMVRRAARQYPNLTVVDGEYAGYPVRVFSDGSHLDVEGAYALSDSLAALIQANPPARPFRTGRWLNLPAFRPVVMEIPLEDFASSRAAVFGGSGLQPAATLGPRLIAHPGGADAPRR